MTLIPVCSVKFPESEEAGTVRHRLQQNVCYVEQQDELRGNFNVAIVFSVYKDQIFLPKPSM